MIRQAIYIGIIPANTGRISAGGCFWIWLPDHPREYGENFRGTIDQLKALGSSPRIRGEFNATDTHTALDGIIPANTGRMIARACSTTASRDHPREYGENFLFSDFSKAAAGSSPRIRGESTLLSSTPPTTRIIPANTGRISILIY